MLVEFERIKIIFNVFKNKRKTEQMAISAKFERLKRRK